MWHLKTCIFISIIVGLLSTNLSLLWYCYQSNIQTIQEDAKKITKKQSQIVCIAVNEMFRRHEESLDMIGSLFLEGAENFIKKISMIKDFKIYTTYIRRDGDISGLIFADNKGSFVSVGVPEDVFLEDGIIPKAILCASSLGVRVIKPQEKKSHLYFVGKKIFQYQGIETSYDPRIYPWFKNATKAQGEIVWTQPYVFSGSLKGQVGLVVSRQLNNHYTNTTAGVVGADILLKEFSSTLQKYQKMFPWAHFYLLNNQKEVISTSSDEKFMKINGEKLSFKMMSRIQDHFIVYQMPLTHDKYSLIMVVDPQIITQSLESERYKILFMASILIVISLILSIWFARRLSFPLAALSEETTRIRKLELDHKFPLTSNIYELQNLIESIQQLKKTIKFYSAYIPTGLAAKLLKRKQSSHGGKEKDITVMFSDIADFTTISEASTPEAISQYLYEYFTEISNIIMENKGNVDKYMGDGIMAFWGAPDPDRHHPFHACISALRCRERLKILNYEWKKKGRPAFLTRIAIHSGKAIVGNIGSSERMNYTAMGDMINECSRLEGINKIYSTDILISEAVYQLVNRSFLTRPLDRLTVKGKKKHIKVYEIIGCIEKGYQDLLPDEDLIHYIERYKTAHNLFMGRQWEEALLSFEKLKYEKPYDSVVLRYIEICKDYIENPPPSDWNGVIHVMEK